LSVLPLGAVQPNGWLRTQLELQRDGLTGHAEELYDDIGNSYWLTGRRLGDEFSGTFDDRYSWERGPYYIKGLVSLAFALDDAKLKARAKRWIDSILDSQRDNGDFGPKNDNWWANMPALCAVRDWGAATGDMRVIPFLRRYFRFQLQRLPEHPLSADSFWAVARSGDNMEVVIWLVRETGETWPLQLAKMLAFQSADWERYYRFGGVSDGTEGLRQHIVNFMQGLKEPALAWAIGCAGAEQGNETYAAAFDANGWEMRQHGRVDRMLNGTEPLSGRDACQGTELCAIAERILSCQCVLAMTGLSASGLVAADDLESVAYNTLPSTLSDDGKGIRYYNILNLPRCQVKDRFGFENNGEGSAMVPGPDAGYGCCRSNFHFAWPKFVQSMWMRSRGKDCGLVAVAYGPCVVSNELATIVESGNYPFGDRVTLKFTRTNGAVWPLTLRRPRWCAEKDVIVKLNGEVLQRGHLVPIMRKWASGDELELLLPAKITVEKGIHDSIAVRRGALVYALKIEADVAAHTTTVERTGYPVREYLPKSAWNYALKCDEGNLDAVYEPPTDLSGNVFAHGRITSSLKVGAYRTDYAGWGTFRTYGHYSGRALEPPPSPLAMTRHDPKLVDVMLIPMGATQIRIVLFPWTE